jgi:hypothetical protein
LKLDRIARQRSWHLGSLPAKVLASLPCRHEPSAGLFRRSLRAQLAAPCVELIRVHVIAAGHFGDSGLTREAFLDNSKFLN